MPRTKLMKQNHSGEIDKSAMLTKADIWIRQRFTFTTVQALKAWGCCSVRDVVRHLRANGRNISRAYIDHIKEDGTRVFRYDYLGAK